jgi:hypothetical protein
MIDGENYRSRIPRTDFSHRALRWADRQVWRRSAGFPLGNHFLVGWTDAGITVSKQNCSRIVCARLLESTYQQVEHGLLGSGA